MRFLFDKISELNIGWNERPLTESEFYRVCRCNKIQVQEMPLRVSGFYYRVKGRDFIAIDSKLVGAKKLFVMYHELGHFLFHAPESGATANFHGIGRKTRPEDEADLFAICALLPTTLIKDRNLGEWIDEGFSAELIDLRREVIDRYGF